MWNTSATKRITADGRRQVTITYISDTEPPETITESFDAYPGMSDDDIAQRAAAGLARADASRSAFDDLIAGDLSDAVTAIQTAPVPVKLPPVVEPPVIPSARDLFLTDYYRWQRMQRAVALGVMAANDPTLASLQKSLVAAYLPEYLEVL